MILVNIYFFWVIKQLLTTYVQLQQIVNKHDELRNYEFKISIHLDHLLKQPFTNRQSKYYTLTLNTRRIIQYCTVLRATVQFKSQ